MNVGFIGTGSMGSILIESMIKTDALKPDQIVATNRTFAKAERLAEVYTGLKAVPSNREVALAADMIFLCVKPKEFKNVIDDIKPYVTAAQTVVSITSPVLIRHLEEHIPCKIAKIIPSITNYVCSGATLTMYGSRMEAEDIETLDRLLQRMSKPLVVSEEYTRISSDISSCGPAFLAFFVEQFVQAAVTYTGISKEEATKLASEMVLGTGLLLTAGGFSPESLRERVTVPGGITAEGLRMLSLDLDGTFERLIRTTHHKYKEELDKVEGLFYNPQS
ncbi:late competence protein ComER [Paenibacillus antri]|uniref:Pyrroline-5-carboxylate reductase n=1 Tax=Paenibacillus antri TaxID=2582848 RepID=A0A5R9GB73_9BACL|nr:late competence protein ComER [Paenibacillus antri]TLS53712.1 late competence protein ComER [Paenibacillus antri]